MFTKLSPTDLARHRTTRSHPEYAEFLASLSVGEGGRVDLSKTGVKRQTVKNRLNSAAAGCGETWRCAAASPGRTARGA